ncbi:MAG: hypothetical protein ACO4CI_06585 [Phycisphaerales bacterium]
MTESNESFEPSAVTLTEADAAAVDALIDAGFELDRVPEAMRPRAAAALAVFRRLEAVPGADADDASVDSLVDATLLRIDRHEEEQAARLSYREHTEARSVSRARLRFADFVGVAAIAILAVSIAIPLMSHVRTSRGIAACGDGMRSLGGSFAAFANDHQGNMPFAASLVPGLDFGSGRFPMSGSYRHGDQLRTLADEGYCDSAACLGCPNHPTPGGTYSFRVPASAAELRMDLVPALVIVGDRNPVIELVLGGQRVQVEMCSPEHDDRGQNVMRGDGSVVFLRDPRLKGERERPDNIWLPVAGQGGLAGEVATVEGDVFLLN